MSAQAIQPANIWTTEPFVELKEKYRHLVYQVLASFRAGQSKAHFAQKRVHANKTERPVDVLSSLSVIEKQRLGMHSLIN